MFFVLSRDIKRISLTILWNSHVAFDLLALEVLPGNAKMSSVSLVKSAPPSQLLTQLNSGQLLVVDGSRRNGLIIYKRYHAEFAGPGAAVGGFFDVGVRRVLAVGDLSLTSPENYEDRQKAYLIRRHWIRLTEQLTENPVPLQRAQMLITQFEHYFDPEVVSQMPDEALSLLVGVLPMTIRMIRHSTPKVQHLVTV